MHLFDGLPAQALHYRSFFMLNPKFAQSYAIAVKIPYRKNKRLAILKWCAVTKLAIGK